MATSLYRDAMEGIRAKVAMQAIRKIIRASKKPDSDQLADICTIIHEYEDDTERDQMAAEKAELAAEEAEMRRQQAEDELDEMMEKLSIRGDGK